MAQERPLRQLRRDRPAAERTVVAAAAAAAGTIQPLVSESFRP